MSSSADALLQAAPAQLFGSSKSVPKEKLQWQASTNHEVYFMSFPGSRSQKFDSCSSSSSSFKTAINQEKPKMNNSSLNLNQATALPPTLTVPPQSISMTAATDRRDPAPEKNAQSSTVTGDEKQRVCKTCESRYEKEDNTSNVEEWLYSDTCANCQKGILNYHRSISRLQSPNHHTTTNYHHEEDDDSCCCF